MSRFPARRFWPFCAFLAVLGLHFVWVGTVSERDAVLAGWVPYPVERSWWSTYLDTQAYWLGYAYASSAAFGVYATAAFLRDRSCASRSAALGGFTLTGGLALSGCFLLGCCGSPMLAVWLGLFGTAFPPLAKPFMAVATTAMLLAAWLWMRRQRNRSLSGPATVDWQEDRVTSVRGPSTTTPRNIEPPSSLPTPQEPR